MRAYKTRTLTRFKVSPKDFRLHGFEKTVNIGGPTCCNILMTYFGRPKLLAGYVGGASSTSTTLWNKRFRYDQRCDWNFITSFEYCVHRWCYMGWASPGRQACLYRYGTTKLNVDVMVPTLTVVMYSTDLWTLNLLLWIKAVCINCTDVDQCFNNRQRFLGDNMDVLHSAPIQMLWASSLAEMFINARGCWSEIVKGRQCLSQWGLETSRGISASKEQSFS